MSKQDYELIASALRAELLEHGPSEALERITTRLARDLQIKNSRFDRDRFCQWIYGRAS